MVQLNEMQSGKENVAVNAFCDTTSHKISKLDEKFISFSRNIGEEIQNIRSSASFTGQRTNEVKKAHILRASTFIQNQQNKVSQIESSLPPLVDMLLGNKTNAKDRMNMADLSSTCRHLHALQAKQLLHLESTLVTEYGYITAAQREEEEDENNGFIQEFEDEDLYEGNQEGTRIDNADVSSENVGHNTSSCNTPTWMMRNNAQFDQFQPTPSLLEQRLPRLSEATLETDAGTPGSVLTLDRILSPGTVNVNGQVANGNNRRGSIMSLKSLAEEEDSYDHGASGDSDVDAGVTYNSEGDDDLSYDVEKERAQTRATPLVEEGKKEMRVSLTPKTPSIAEIKLSMAAISLIERDSDETSNALAHDDTHWDADHESFEEDEKNIENGYGRGSSVYDSCEESFDSTSDGAMSIASTVVQQKDIDNLMVDCSQNLNRTVIPDCIVENKQSEMVIDSGKNESNDDKIGTNLSTQETTRTLNYEDESVRINNFEDPTDCSLTRITVRSNADASVRDIQVQDESIINFDKFHASIESEEVVSSSGEMDPSNLSRESRSITIDTSVYHHPSVQELNEAHVDTSILLETKTPRNRQVPGTNAIEKVLPDGNAVTSPLDRFQVQVFNGGSDCKVTPIGNIVDSIQSPIMKAQSPVTFAGKVNSSIDKFGTAGIQDVAKSTELLENTFPSPQTQHIKKKYPKTPAPDMSEKAKTAKTSVSEVMNESNNCENAESFYSSNTSEPEYSNGSISNRQSSVLNDYSASAFLPNLSSSEGKTLSANDEPEKSASVSGNTSPREAFIAHKQKLNIETPVTNEETDVQSKHRTPGGSLFSTIISKTPRAAAFIEKHMSDEKEHLFQVLNKGFQSESSKNVSTSSVRQSAVSHRNDLATDFASESKPPPTFRPNIPGIEEHILEQLGLQDDSKLMSPLTADEFDASPPIIKKLVTREDINRGIVLINNWLVSCKVNSPPSVPENIASDILGDAFNASQVKRIFLSLCSLQRMMISRKTSDSGESIMHYVIL